VSKTLSRNTTRGILVGGLEVQFVAHDGELVVLELFQRFLDIEVKDDTRSIDHAGAKEPENGLRHAHEPNCRKNRCTPFIKVVTTYTGVTSAITVE